jgi:hypothetical protein
MEKAHKKRQAGMSLEGLFGNVLQQLRKEKGLSQEDLGLESGYCQWSFKSVPFWVVKSEPLAPLF